MAKSASSEKRFFIGWEKQLGNIVTCYLWGHNINP